MRGVESKRKKRALTHRYWRWNNRFRRIFKDGIIRHTVSDSFGVVDYRRYYEGCSIIEKQAEG
jgi:hypothetical protein